MSEKVFCRSSGTHPALHKNIYLLDGIPIDSIGIIKEACYYDKEFDALTIRFVSEAKQILRKLGHTVEDNPDYDVSS